MPTNDFNILIALLGGIVLLLGLGSKWLSASPLPPTLLALLAGVAVGPAALGAIDLEALDDQAMLLERAARLTLGIGLVGVALRIPAAYPRQHWREMLTLIGLGMPLMWAISTLLVFFILGLPFWLAALIGAAITPTDPVAAVYYAATMEGKLGETVIWDVVSLVACASVVAHGLTGAPLTKLYGRVAGKREKSGNQDAM